MTRKSLVFYTSKHALRNRKGNERGSNRGTDYWLTFTWCRRRPIWHTAFTW